MGPLTGIRIVELAAIGPVSFAGMLLSDFGADVVRIDRIGGDGDLQRTLMRRGRRSIAVDLKSAAGVSIARRLIESADVFLEGMRPGVLERLGLHPDALLEASPRLVIGRMTGWGQDGPYASQAGHDINYLGVTGGLHAIGARGEPPPPPLNLVADFGGGAMYLVAGVLAALVARDRSGSGQVVDAAMVDGASSLLTMFHELVAAGVWSTERESNALDGGAPFYRTYACRDGALVSVGALEPQFYAALIAGLGFGGEELPSQADRARWPEVRMRFADRFAERNRDEWLAVFAGSDACVFPVHSLVEAPGDPHLDHRGTLVDVSGGIVPAPAPRFSRTPAAHGTETPGGDGDSRSILTELGYAPEEIDAWQRRRIVG